MEINISKGDGFVYIGKIKRIQGKIFVCKSIGKHPWGLRYLMSNRYSYDSKVFFRSWRSIKKIKKCGWK